MKKFAALVLAGAMTLGLAACGGGNTSTPAASATHTVRRSHRGHRRKRPGNTSHTAASSSPAAGYSIPM